MGNRLVSSMFYQISLLEKQVSLLNQILAFEKQIMELELKNIDLREDLLKTEARGNTNTRFQANVCGDSVESLHFERIAIQTPHMIRTSR